ncbi:MAG: SapC family protein [Thermodesulfobacteriota bacterium]
MSNWIALSPSQQANKHYLPRQGYSFAADQQAVPILLAELPKLLPHYPLAFIQQESTYQPVVLTGLGGGQNLYVNHDGKWLATYVPAFLRSYPFRLLTAENKQQVLCIQEDHLVDDSQGEPLFDSEGNLTKPVQDTLNFLNECEKNRRVTQAACAALDKSAVIERWPLQIKQQEGQEPVQVDGLFRISEKALNELDAETFSGLRSHGALALAYAQLFSMNQINQLVERAKYHARQQAKQEEPDIEQLFGEDDVLNFDNI